MIIILISTLFIEHILTKFTYVSDKKDTSNASLHNLNISQDLLVYQIGSDILSAPYTNHISLFTDKKNCTFSTPLSLCIFQSGTFQKNQTLKVQCQKLPCKFQFMTTTEQKKLVDKHDKFSKYIQLPQGVRSWVQIFGNQSQDMNKQLIVYSHQEIAHSSKDQLFQNYYFQFKKPTKVRLLLVPLTKKVNFKLTVGSTPGQFHPKKDEISNDIIITKNYYRLQQTSKQGYFQFGFRSVYMQGKQGNINIQIKQISYKLDVSLTSFLSSMGNNILIPATSLPNKFILVLKSSIVMSFTYKYQILPKLSITNDQIIYTDVSGSYEVVWAKGQKIDGQVSVKYELYDDLEDQSNQKKQAQKKIDVKINPQHCKFNDKCTVSVQCPQKSLLSLILMFPRQKIQDVQYIPLKLNSPITTTMFQQEMLYFVFNNTKKSKNPLLIIVGPDVTVFIDWKQKCKKPNSKCSQIIGNNNRPAIIKGKALQKQVFFISILSQISAYITISIQQTQSQQQIPLTLAIPATSFIKKNPVYFSLNLPNQMDVQLTLNAPTNQLILYANQGSDSPTQEVYDYFNKESFDMKGKKFTIMVKKRNESSLNIVSFQLLAVADGKIQFLHYNRPVISRINDSSKQYLLVTDPQLQIFLNFELLQGQPQKMHIIMSKNNKKHQFNISHQIHTFQITQLLKEWCQEQDQLEQLREMVDVKLQEQDQMCHTSLEIATSDSVKYKLTLFENSMATQLIDGKWLKYNLQQMDSSTHFFYIPTNYKNSQNIYYYSSTGRVVVYYKLWLMDKDIPKNQWPYPKEKQTYEIISFQKSKTITADNLKPCKPNCIILFSVNGINQSDEKQVKIVRQQFYNQFSIIVSSGHFEIKDSQRINVGIEQGQIKYFQYQLKKFMEEGEGEIYIQVDQVVGSVYVSASVSSPENPRYPSFQQNDFLMAFSGNISFKNISDIIKRQRIQPQMAQLVIAIESVTSTKPAQVIILVKIKKQNLIDLFEQSAQNSFVNVNKTEIFCYINFGVEQFKIKIQKISGFPQIAVKGCDLMKDIQDCIQQIEQQKDNNKQLLAKDFQILMNNKHKEYCKELCRYMILVYAPQQQIEIQIIIIPSNSHVLLNQGIVFPDFGVKDQENKYQLTGKSNQSTVITISLLQGEANASLTIPNLNKTYKTNKQVNPISLKIPPINSLKAAKKKKQNIDDFDSILNDVLYADQNEMYVIVKCLKDCSYTISYTTGDNLIQLIDGLLTMGSVSKDKSVQYVYPLNKSKAIISFTFTNNLDMHKAQISYTRILQNDQHSPYIKIDTQLSNKHQKIDSPVIVFSLNQTYSMYQFKVQTQQNQAIPFSILISQLDLIYLPMNTTFPIHLDANKTNFYQTTILDDGHLSIDIRLCSASQIKISYTKQYQQFVDNNFQETTKLSKRTFNNIMRVKKGNVIFFKIQSIQKEALYSVTLNFFKKKIQDLKQIQPGNNGNIDYEIIQDKTAKIKFNPVLCQDCQVDYYYIADFNQKTVISQSNCPNSYFVDHNIKGIKPIHLKVKQSSPISFSYHMTNEIDVVFYYKFVSVKAVVKYQNLNFQVPYNTIELVTNWGTVHKNFLFFKIIIGIMVFLCAYCVLCRRRKSSQGYQNLNDQD